MKANDMKKTLTRVLLIAGGIAYIWAIISIGNISLASPNKIEMKDDTDSIILDSEGKPVMTDAEPPKIEEFFLTIVSLIGTALAVHTGKLLGQPPVVETESGKPTGKEVGKESGDWLARFYQNPIVAFLKGAFIWLWKAIKKLLGFDLANIPQIASLLYLIGLVIGVYFYFREERSPASAELLKTSWTSLLGLLAGVWGAIE